MELLNQELEGLRLLRFDRDSTGGRDGHRRLLDRFAAGEADVLIGTQMLAKGMDLPRVTLAAVLAADGLLHRPDLRASEQALQLLMQLAGRAGRGERPGQVLVQTYSPDHPVIRHLVDGRYEVFLAEEIELRREAGLVPFSRACLLRLSGESASATATAWRSGSGRSARTRAGGCWVPPPPLWRGWLVAAAGSCFCTALLGRPFHCRPVRRCGRSSRRTLRWRWIPIPWSFDSGGEFWEAEAKAAAHVLQQKAQHKQQDHPNAAHTEGTPSPVVGVQADQLTAADCLNDLATVQPKTDCHRWNLWKLLEIQLQDQPLVHANQPVSLAQADAWIGQGHAGVATSQLKQLHQQGVEVRRWQRTRCDALMPWSGMRHRQVRPLLMKVLFESLLPRQQLSGAALDLP